MNILKYKKNKYKDHIITERTNFLFLDDNSMIYDYDKFNDYVEAIIDSINKGEDLDDMISLIFPEKVDHQLVKQKILNIMQNETKN